MFIKQHRHQRQSTFDVCERGADGRYVVVRTLRVVYVSTRLKTGETRHIVYDEEMRPILDIYRYLNVSLKNISPSTIQRTVSALRLLVAFCEAHHIKGFTVPERLCQDFQDFLYRDGQASSAAVYFSSVRGFLKYIGHDHDPLMTLTVRQTTTTGADGSVRTESHKDYKYAPKRNPEKDLMCPQHNTVNDFVKITEVMKGKRFHNGDLVDIAGCIIILLAFFLARRIGEILGLTIEDVSYTLDAETGEMIPCLYLRKRLGNREGQRAKNRVIPTSKESYASKDYIDAYKSVRNRLLIPKEFHDLIRSYIEVFHAKAAEKRPDRYAEAMADIVNPEQFQEDWGLEENHYLFLNTVGGPLKKSAWNKRLLGYYKEAGVAVGNGKSPNHAWRHGIAYIMRHKLHMSDSEIADFLGHKNEASVDIYARASAEDMARLGTIVAQFIKNEIDSLKHGKDIFE